AAGGTGRKTTRRGSYRVMRSRFEGLTILGGAKRCCSAAPTKLRVAVLWAVHFVSRKRDGAGRAGVRGAPAQWLGFGAGDRPGGTDGAEHRLPANRRSDRRPAATKRGARRDECRRRRCAGG